MQSHGGGWKLEGTTVSLSSRLLASRGNPLSTILPSQGRARPGHHPHGPPEEDPGQHPDHEGPADRHPGTPPAPLTKLSQPQANPAARGLAGLAGSQSSPRLLPLLLGCLPVRHP